VAVDSGLSHAWIFPLYVALLYATIRWHDRPGAVWALLIGCIIGLATICRPTEAVALFIPLLWSTHTPEAAKQKWRLVRMHPFHVLTALLGGLFAILPQLLYWKLVTGSVIYDVGSKWLFLNPWFRVLTGWEKGWFIYTPVTLFFVLGMFFIRSKAFRYSALVFCGLTIWIVIAWEDWQYGASYSTRALVQSYPVFALPFAALVDRVARQQWRVGFWVLCLFLIAVNLFQIIQYNSGILHFRDMNWQYYGRIYLNTDPSPIDMSLMDTKTVIADESRYEVAPFTQLSTPIAVAFAANEQHILIDTVLPAFDPSTEYWLKLDAKIDAAGSLWQARIGMRLERGDSTLQSSIRLFNPVGERTGAYAFYLQVPHYFQKAPLKVFLTSQFDFSGELRGLHISQLSRSTDVKDPN